MTRRVLIPVKAFRDAKLRLAPVLRPSAREALVRQMAEQVLRAARSLPVSVVCDDPEVRDWAEAHGATVLWCPGRGLNGAVSDGVESLGDAGATEVIVAHADLPLADDLDRAAGFEGITLVPDRHDDGTNVMCLPARCGFRFAYGPASFRRHRAEATRLGLAVRVLVDRRLGWDVDVPADLVLPSELEPTPSA